MLLAMCAMKWQLSMFKQVMAGVIMRLSCDMCISPHAGSITHLVRPDSSENTYSTPVECIKISTHKYVTSKFPLPVSLKNLTILSRNVQT